jgi:hypothetical protein
MRKLILKGEIPYAETGVKSKRQSMIQPDGSYRIPGTLVDQQGVTHEIELLIVTKQLHGESGLEDEAISEIKFASRSAIPDGGPYMLRYVFNGRRCQDQMRVKFGVLITA